MNLFIKHTLIFTIILFVYFGINYTINSYYIDTCVPQIKDARIMIAGDSHPDVALESTFFSSVNKISQPAESYVITYWKLKKLLQYTNPDTLFLGFSFHNFSAANDKKKSNPERSHELAKRIYPISNLKDIGILRIDKLTYFRTVFLNMCIYPKTNHDYYLRKFNSTGIGNISEWESVVKGHYYYEGHNAGISSSSINYLDSIIYLTHKKNIQVVLVVTPLHKDYRKNIPENFVMGFRKIKAELEKRNVIILDYGEVVYDDSCFFDPDHLNHKGAMIFTREIKSQLSGGSNFTESLK